MQAHDSIRPRGLLRLLDDWWNPILEHPIRIDKGVAMIDGALGSGVSWNEAAIDKYIV